MVGSVITSLAEPINSKFTGMQNFNWGVKKMDQISRKRGVVRLQFAEQRSRNKFKKLLHGIINKTV